MPRRKPAPTTDSAAPARDRILDAATRLFQRRGYHAVGTIEILDAAGAPKGSMYHHFPLGKEQIAIAAVERIRGDLLAALHAQQAAGRSLEATIRRLGRGIARWLRSSAWREGALLSSISVGTVSELPGLHAAIRGAFDAWRAALADWLAAQGWTAPAAQATAQLLVASIEGAMILVRVDQDERSLLRVVDALAGLVATRPRRPRRPR